MTLFDDASQYAESIDLDAEHMRGHGFEPSVCEGCPKRLDNTRGKPCDFCGCPTVPGLLLDRLQAPPAQCIRLDQHARRSR